MPCSQFFFYLLRRRGSLSSTRFETPLWVQRLQRRLHSKRLRFKKVHVVASRRNTYPKQGSQCILHHHKRMRPIGVAHASLAFACIPMLSQVRRAGAAGQFRYESMGDTLAACLWLSRRRHRSLTLAIHYCCILLYKLFYVPLHNYVFVTLWYQVGSPFCYVRES